MKFQQQFQQKQQQQQSQRLAMTQELQQSIQILQYNTEELWRFVAEKSLENPLLEVQEESNVAALASSAPAGDSQTYLSQIPDQHGSLFESLIEQIHLNYRDTELRRLVLYLVEFVDLNGYLTTTLEEAQVQTGATPIQMLDALTLLQQLDPAGVGARSLQESLMLQTERDQQAPALAYIILEEDFEPFVQRKWPEIAKKYQIDLPQVQLIFDYVRSLSPAPGAAFGAPEGLYIVPDLTLLDTPEGWQLRSNRRSMPNVKLQSRYFEKMSKTNDPEVQKYLKEKKQEFDWITKTIEQRGDTIMRVGQAILERQPNFFAETTRPLKPMQLKEIAEELGLHESTISRAVNGKYLETPFGVYELRSFFTHASGGEDLSVDTTRQALQQLIDAENKQKPLSDQKIVELLAAKGIDLSRRTVAKYRDQLHIPSSSKRKRFE